MSTTDANNAGDIGKTKHTVVIGAGWFYDVSVSISWGGGVHIIEVTAGPGWGIHGGYFPSKSKGGTL
jgi:hypothetical protein